MPSDTGYGLYRRLVVGRRVKGTSRIGDDHAIIPHTLSVLRNELSLSSSTLLMPGNWITITNRPSVKTEGVCFSELSVPFPARY